MSNFRIIHHSKSSVISRAVILPCIYIAYFIIVFKNWINKSEWLFSIPTHISRNRIPLIIIRVINAKVAVKSRAHMLVWKCYEAWCQACADLAQRFSRRHFCLGYPFTAVGCRIHSRRQSFMILSAIVYARHPNVHSSHGMTKYSYFSLVNIVKAIVRIFHHRYHSGAVGHAWAYDIRIGSTGITMKICIHGYHAYTSACKLNWDPVEHLAVVQVSVAGNHHRCGSLRCCSERAVQCPAYPFSVVTGNFDFADIHSVKISLKYVCSDAAYQCKYNCYAQYSCGFLSFHLQFSFVII